jgi:uncharacterized protein (TIGR03000 family)
MCESANEDLGPTCATCVLWPSGGAAPPIASGGAFQCGKPQLLVLNFDHGAFNQGLPNSFNASAYQTTNIDVYSCKPADAAKIVDKFLTQMQSKCKTCGNGLTILINSHGEVASVDDVKSAHMTLCGETTSADASMNTNDLITAITGTLNSYKLQTSVIAVDSCFSGAVTSTPPDLSGVVLVSTLEYALSPGSGNIASSINDICSTCAHAGKNVTVKDYLNCPEAKAYQENGIFEDVESNNDNGPKSYTTSFIGWPPPPVLPAGGATNASILGQTLFYCGPTIVGPPPALENAPQPSQPQICSEALSAADLAKLGTPLSATRAYLIATVPANAALTVDGRRTTSTGTWRTYVTPALTPGKVYTYSLTATWKDAKNNLLGCEQKFAVTASLCTVYDFAKCE